MKIVTWNVNSLRVRLQHVLNWSAEHQPDVICLQETKSVDEKFPVSKLQEAGFNCSFSGQKTYNGVAILVRGEIDDVVVGLPGYDDPQKRVLSITTNGIRVINIYVPNGSSVGSDKYAYKLTWFEHLLRFVENESSQHENLVVTGDFNIAPADEDVHDPEEWRDKILCSKPERANFQELIRLGLFDIFRHFEQPAKSYSWWDYRAASFRRNRGLRIDHILVSDALRRLCTSCFIDVDPRRWERPSDHTPVVAEFKTPA